MGNVFPRDRTDLVPSPLENVCRQDLLDKMLKDHVEVAVLCTVSELLHVKKLNTHSQSFLANSSLIKLGTGKDQSIPFLTGSVKEHAACGE